jgi:hypothetical protein
MRLLAPVPIQTNHAAAASRRWPALVATGLAIQIAAPWWPTAPVLAAMTLVALGATVVLIERFRGAAGLPHLLVAHLIVYGSIYLLFAGAVWHANSTGVRSHRAASLWLDLAASAMLMGMTVRAALTAMRAREAKTGRSDG